MTEHDTPKAEQGSPSSNGAGTTEDSARLEANIDQQPWGPVPRALLVGTRVGVGALIATMLALLVGTAYPAVNDSTKQDPGELAMEVALLGLLATAFVLGLVAIVLGMKHREHPFSRNAITRGWLALLVTVGAAIISISYLNFAGKVS